MKRPSDTKKKGYMSLTIKPKITDTKVDMMTITTRLDIKDTETTTRVHLTPNLLTINYLSLVL
jgi:hypothetical protein